ncbi:hypothetical protein BGZ81_011043 [Podila clonocystis]|nr:hypothetical protein BGZ81_011043 [Podila clonocystis]
MDESSSTSMLASSPLAQKTPLSDHTSPRAGHPSRHEYMNGHDHLIFHQPLQQPHHHSPHPSPPEPQPQPQLQTNGHGRHHSLSLSPSNHTDLQQVVPQRVKSEPQDLDLELLSELPVAPEGQKLIVRLDLRKLGSLNAPVLSRPSSAQDLTSSDHAIAGKRNSLRQLPKRSEDVRTASDQQSPDSAPSSDAISKAPETSTPTETPQVHVEVELPAHATSTLLTPCSDPVERIPSAETSSRRSSVSLDYSESQNMDADDDEDYMDTGSQATKRRASSKTLPNPVAKKRTRSSVQGEAKKKETPIPQLPTPPPVKKKSSPKPKDKKPASAPTPKDVVSITGDDLALKYNNDYCENCLGLGRFICCDSCPKAFHFSCCQPPVDPADLPDEWNCNECRAKKNPPKPSPKGIFKQLLDNVNRMNPKAFMLPPEIRSFFKGVVTNSDGEYAETVDYKPSPRRTPAGHAAAAAQAMEEPYQLQDSQGNVRLCYHCHKSAFGGRMMISCEHCPLHWHLDCLSPPMASPPPSTRKWMCPNHADHILPRRRKRKDAASVTLSDPSAPNDGDIEVIPDEDRDDFWDQDLSGLAFRVPERSIKLGFLNKMRRIEPHSSEPPSIPKQPTEENASWRFDLLVAAMVASNHEDLEPSGSSPMSLTPSSSSSSQKDKDQESRQEAIQDSVLSHLTNLAEREEYLRFRSFQRFVRETGAEGVMRQWVQLQEREKEQAATQALLEL